MQKIIIKSISLIYLFWRYGQLKNLDWEHLGPYLRNKNFPKHAICIGKLQITYFHYTTNSVKIKDQFFQSIQKTLFLAQFWSFSKSWGEKKNCGKSSSIIHKFIWISSTMPKFRKNLKIQFQGNAWKDQRTEGWNGRTNRPYFVGPFCL